MAADLLKLSAVEDCTPAGLILLTMLVTESFPALQPSLLTPKQTQGFLQCRKRRGCQGQSRYLGTKMAARMTSSGKSTCSSLSAGLPEEVVCFALTALMLGLVR